MTQSKSEPKREEDGAGIGADYQRDWPRYFDAVRGKPARETAILALKLFAAEGDVPRLAIDIACGEGRDTRAILGGGKWSVMAVDAHDEAIRRTVAQLEPADQARCTVVQAKMEEMATDRRLQQSAEFINASFALPFCEPTAFPLFWRWVNQMLKPGGRFAGQFFGERDDWYPVRPGSHTNRQKLTTLFQEFMIEHLDEVEKDGDDAMGGMKHHHVFHVVAKKR